MTQLKKTLRELKFTEPRENMKPSKITVHSTKRLILYARTSSWKSSTKHGTRSLRNLTCFYTDVTAHKLFDHLTKFCSGLHTVDAVDIPQVMKTLFSGAEGVPQYINAMKSAQRKSKRAKLVIHDEYMHAVALKLLLQSGECETEITGVDKTPRRPAQLGGVENDLPGDLRCKKTRRSRLGGRRKTLWWFRNIWSCTCKRTTTEAKTSKSSGSKPAHK